METPSNRPVPIPRQRDLRGGASTHSASPQSRSPQPTPRGHKKEETLEKAPNSRHQGGPPLEGTIDTSRPADKPIESARETLRGRTSSAGSSASSLSSIGTTPRADHVTTPRSDHVTTPRIDHVTTPRGDNQTFSKSSGGRKESNSYNADRNKWVEVKGSVGKKESLDSLSVVPVVEENGHDDNGLDVSLLLFLFYLFSSSCLLASVGA